MALLLNLENTRIGAPVSQAYARIQSIAGSQTNFHISVYVYYNQNARSTFSDPISMTSHVINTSDLKGDILPALYNYLKTLPEYEGATDC